MSEESKPIDPFILDQDDETLFDPETYALAESVETGVEVVPEVVLKTDDLPAIPTNILNQMPVKEYKDIPYSIGFNTLSSIINQRWENWGIEDERFRFFIIASYLFAGRVSETLQLRKDSFKPKMIQGKKFLEIELITLKKKRKFIYKPGVTAENTYFQKPDGKFVKAPYDPKLGEWKPAEPVMRAISLPLEPIDGHELVENDMLKEFIEDYLPKFDSTQEIFNFTRTGERKLLHERIWCWKQMHQIDVGPLRVTKYNPILGKYDRNQVVEKFLCYPHLLRHTRLTHLRKFYNFDLYQLQKFVGWTNPMMAERYVHLSSDDVGAAFIAGLPNSEWKREI